MKAHWDPWIHLPTLLPCPSSGLVALGAARSVRTQHPPPGACRQLSSLRPLSLAISFPWDVAYGPQPRSTIRGASLPSVQPVRPFQQPHHRRAAAGLGRRAGGSAPWAGRRELRGVRGAAGSAGERGGGAGPGRARRVGAAQPGRRRWCRAGRRKVAVQYNAAAAARRQRPWRAEGACLEKVPRLPFVCNSWGLGEQV